MREVKHKSEMIWFAAIGGSIAFWILVCTVPEFSREFIMTLWHAFRVAANF